MMMTQTHFVFKGGVVDCCLG